jgi:hypothetical protein
VSCITGLVVLSCSKPCLSALLHQTGPFKLVEWQSVGQVAKDCSLAAAAPSEMRGEDASTTPSFILAPTTTPCSPHSAHRLQSEAGTLGRPSQSLRPLRQSMG